VLAKFGQTVTRRAAAAGREEDDASESRIAAFLALLRHVPPRVDPIAFWARVALLVVFAVWGVAHIMLDYRTGEIGAAFLHRPLLVFHEAGHVVFMPFGQFLMVAGGTLGQLIMPLVLAGALLFKNRDPFGASIGVWLVGVSLLDIAPYAYDARDPQLILLGGHTGEEGGHDWIYLLGTFGMVAKSQAVGWFIHKLGALVIVLAIAWGAWLLKQQKSRIGPDGAIED
jgi:hypothetical protein